MALIFKENGLNNNDGIIGSSGGNSIGGAGHRLYSKSGSTADPLYQISREVIELVKMSPKSTMKFNRFIPAYHNHFGKQCRVADYGYTKLIELFEALSSVVQIMGDGENRQITLTHRTQIRRFTTDLLRILRTQGNKSILLSQLPEIFTQTQNRHFDVTDYGVCSLVDILDGLANSNIVVMTTIQNGKDIIISIPKRKQTTIEVEKTCVFGSEVIELFRNAPNYSILFQKFVRSYHYHFGYQCRLSDYGFLKLADLMESIQGIVDIEFTNDEDKKIFLTPIIARRVFAEQLENLIRNVTTSSKTCMKLDDVLNLHKKKFGYQIQSQILGYPNIIEAIKNLPYVEVISTDELLWIICHNEDPVFRNNSYLGYRCKVCEISVHKGCISSTGRCKQNPVNQPPPVCDRQLSEFNWFVGTMDRETAANKLENRRVGTYLLRVRPQGAQNPNETMYALSLKTDEHVIKHMKINQKHDSDSIMYGLSSRRYFRTIVELVSYYERNDLGENFAGLNQSLKWPFKEVIAKAIYDFEPNGTNQLPLRQGCQVIVIGKDGDSKGWWRGKIGDTVGYFPKEYVKEQAAISDEL